MKNKLIFSVLLVSLLAFGLVFVGCSSAPSVYVFDESVALEQSSTVLFNQAYQRILSVNGKKTPSDWEKSLRSKSLQIPAGEHTLEVYCADSNSNYDGSFTHSSGTVAASFTFLPGHTYFLVAPIKNGKINLQLIDMAVLNNELLPDPENPEATPFEGKWVNTKDSGQYLIFAEDEFLISINDGKIAYRGFFAYDNRRVYITRYFRYAENKWKPYGPEDSTLSYNGDVMEYSKLDQYKKQ